MKLRPAIFFLLAAIALLLLFPSLNNFLFDEALLQYFALEANAHGRLAARGLVGTVGQAYGPLAVWFYQGLQLLTCDLHRILFLKALLSGAISLCSLRILARRARVPFCLFALTLLLAPYSWYWQRTVWDNVLQIPLELAALAAFAEALDRAEKRPLPAALLFALSFGCALAAIWLHTMALPFLAALGCHLLLLHPKTLCKAWKCLLAPSLATAAILLALLIPRFTQTRDALRAGRIASEHATLARALANALSFPRVLGQIDQFSATVHRPVAGLALPWKPIWDTLDLVLLLSAAILILGGMAFTILHWRERHNRPDVRLGAFALILLACQTLFILALRLKSFHIHYQQPILAAAILLAALGAKWEPPLPADRRASAIPLHRHAGLALWCTWCVAGALSILTLLAHVYLTDGEPGLPYGMTIHAYQRTARQLVDLEYAGQSYQIRNAVPLFDPRLSPMLPTLLRLERKKRRRFQGPPPQPTAPPLPVLLHHPRPDCGFVEITPPPQ